MLSKGNTKTYEKLGKTKEMVEGAVEKVLTEQVQAKPTGEDIDPSGYVHYVLGFPTLEAIVAFAKAVDLPVEASELHKNDSLYHMIILFDLQDRPPYYANLIYTRLLEYINVGTKTRAYLRKHDVEMLTDGAVAKLKMIGLVWRGTPHN